MSVLVLVGQTRVWICTYHPLFIHKHTLPVLLCFSLIYCSFTFYPSLSAGADSIRECGRWGENSVAGHYIWLEMRKLFSAHHQLSLSVFLLYPNFLFLSLPSFLLHHKPQIRAPQTCVCMDCTKCLCVCAVCVSLCDLVPVWQHPVVMFLVTPPPGSQVERRENRK